MRKTREITIDGPAASRDLGKKFLITEMSAMAADAWAIRALGAMMRNPTRNRAARSAMRFAWQRRRAAAASLAES